jgi:hypothetical protein
LIKHVGISNWIYIEVIDDVTAVSFDTWIFSLASGYVIEIYHEGEVWVGIR